MPYTLKPNKIYAKDPNGAGYLPQNVVTDRTTADMVAEVTAEGTAQKAAIDTKAAEVTAQLANASEMEAMVAGAFSSTTTYVAGQYVIQTVSGVNKLYRFTADHPAGAWIGTDAVQVPLGDDVADLKSAIEKNTDTVRLSPTYTDKYCKIVSGKCIPGDSVYETGSAGWRCYVVDCAPGDAFTINAQGGSQPRAYIFTKNDGTTYTTNRDWTADASELVSDRVIVAPDQAAKLIINDKDTNGLQYKGAYLASRVDDLETGQVLVSDSIDVINSKITDILENYLSLSVRHRTGLIAGTDLNTLTTPGNYYAGTNAIAQSLVNKPSTLTTSCAIYVFSMIAEERIYQMCVESFSTATGIYKRYYNGTSWTEWEKLATLNDIPTTLALSASRRTAIASGTDYNALITPDNYYALSASSVERTNCPTDLAHVLYVIGMINDNRIIQLCQESSLNFSMFMRYYNGTSWTEWKQIVDSGNERLNYTWANVCPVKEAGATISNNVTTVSDGNGNYSISGIPSSAFIYNIYNDNALPDGIIPGQMYALKIDNPSIGVRVRIYWLTNVWDETASVDTVKDTVFTIPKTAVGMRLRFYMPANHNLDAPIVLSPKMYVVNSVGYAMEKAPRYPMMLTIIDDDGDANYYTDLKPLCESKNLSIASAVTTTRIGSANRWMTWDQIKECYLSGCEILAHSYNHMTDDEILTQDISEEQLERWFRANQYDLRSHGIKADILVCNNNTANLVRYQKAARKVFKGAFHAAGYEINNPDTTDRYYIKRYNMGSAEVSSLSDMTDVLDQLVTAGTGWMVWMIHTSARATWSANYVSMLSDAIDYARAHGIQIVTAEHGARHYLGIE